MTDAAPLDLPGPLVTADWLVRHLHHPDLVVLDATAPYGALGPDRAFGIGRWEAAHIPGSRHADLVADLSDPDASFSFAFPTAERLVPALQALGVGAGTTIVIYDDFLNMWATRLWWMLRAISVDAVAILDGGWKAWTAGDHPTEAGAQTALPRMRALHAVARPAFVDVGRVLGQVATPRADEALICALPEAYFTGAEQIGGRGGHIPGSLSIPAGSLLDERGRFLPVEAIRERLAVLAGVERATAYCGGGISATVVAFALHLAAIAAPEIRIYDGSLEEWNADPERPLEHGHEADG